MPRRVNISEARARLPELAKYVTDSEEQVVFIDHRDLPGALVLTTEAHLRYLTTLVRELRGRNGNPFQLAGSITSDLSDEELDASLQEIRDDQHLRSEAKLQDISG